MEQNPLISIITLNYNNAAVTYRFLESTLHFHYKQYEILVIDMNSEYDLPNAEKINRYRNTVLIKNPVNNGFSGGNNLGISKAKGDYIFLLNNDTIVSPDLLNNLLETFILNNLIGIASPMILQLREPNLIEYAGFQKMNMYTARTRAIGFNQPIDEKYLKPYLTASSHGAAMMISKKVIDAIGQLPEKYFLYYEEWEYCLKAAKAGFKIMYNGNARIYHEGSVSTNTGSNIKDYYLNRSRILFMRRNATLMQGTLFIIYYLFIAFPKNLITYLFKNRKGLEPYLSSLNWNLTNKAF
jgi:GT2 family glycosyltransferase